MQALKSRRTSNSLKNLGLQESCEKASFFWLAEGLFRLRCNSIFLKYLSIP